MAEWVKTSGCKIPDNAIRAGYEENGNPLFIARANKEGTWTPGKCSPYYDGAYIPYDGKEFIFKDYDVLVCPINAVGFLDWRKASGGKVPDNAFKTDTDLYVARVNYANDLIPGKVSTRNKLAYMGYGLKEHQTNKEYEVLCQIR